MSSKRFKKLPSETKKMKADMIEKLLGIVKTNCTTKFDESVDLSFQINNKQKKNEINLRTVINMPGGTGKKIKVAVICEESKLKDAKDALKGKDSTTSKKDSLTTKKEKSSVSKKKHHLIGGVSIAETHFNHLCKGNDDVCSGTEWAPLMETDSEKLMLEGCRLAGKTWRRTREILGWKNEEVSRIFCHQVGKGHRKLMYENVGLNMEKDFSTLEFLGNTGSASLPVTFAMGVEKGTLKKGDKAALLGIGSGLNCLMMGVEW